MTTITTRSGKGSPLTNNEVDANFTNLNDDKAELSGAAFTGAITTTSTIDGRDVAADGTKLDGIESGADVTDTANVTAAGALMDSELTSEASVKALDQGVATTDSPTFAGLTTTADVTFGDNDKAIFGAGNDLEIYHSGTNSFISDTGTGSLYIKGGATVTLRNDSDEDMLVASSNGAVTAYYDNAAKLATTSSGIDVTGTVTADSATIAADTGSTPTVVIDNSGGDAGDGVALKVIASQRGSGIADAAVFSVHNNAGEMFRVRNDGNVGIGVSAPSNPLTVLGSAGTIASFTNGADADLLIKAESSVTTLTPTTGTLVLGTSSTERMRITSTGIDVTGSVTADDMVISDGSPTLTFYETDTTNLNARFDNGGGDLYIQTVNDDGSNAKTRILIDHSEGDISFYNSAGTSQDLRWDASTSRLGIGTTSPSSVLETSASDATTWSTSFSGVPSYTPEAQDLTISNTVNNTTGSFASLFLKAGQTSSGSGINTARIAAIREGALSTSLAFSTRSSSGTLDEAIRVNSSGNVGIGTTDLTDSYKTIIEGSDQETANLTDAGTHGATLFLRATGEDVGSGGAVAFGTTNGNKRPFAAIKGYVLDGTANSVGDLVFSTRATTSATALTERMTLTKDGRLVIGDNSPQAKLDVQSDGQYTPAGYFRNNGDTLSWARADWYNNQASGTGIVYRDSSGSFIFRNDNSSGTAMTTALVAGGTTAGNIVFNTTSSAEAARITSAGNVGIGSPSAFGKLSINSNGAPASSGNMTTGLTIHNSTGGTAINIGTNDAGGYNYIQSAYVNSAQTARNLAFFSGAARAVDIDTSGNLLVGTTESLGTGGLTVRPDITQGAAQINFNRATTTNTSFVVVFQDAGTDVGSISYSNTVVAYNTTSDQRLKENIVDAPSASDDIDAIQVRSFDWKADGSHQKYGMVAQELQTVAPEAVTIPDDPEEMAGVDYSKLVPMLVKEIQSLRARVAQLEGAN